MRTIELPYLRGRKELHIKEEQLKAVITARTKEYKADKGEIELIREALESPIGTPCLRKLAEGKKKVVIVTSDHTRAVPEQADTSAAAGRNSKWESRG